MKQSTLLLLVLCSSVLCSEFEWDPDPWGECDRGTQTRIIRCIDEITKNPVDVENCDNLGKRPEDSQLCGPCSEGSEQTQSNSMDAVIGVAFTIGGIFVDNVGVTVMKISHNKQIDIVTENPKAYWKQTRWIIGFLLFCLGNIMNGVGLSYAAQSLFAAVGSLTLVFNALNAWLILHERITKRIIFGTVLIVGGSIVGVFFGSHHSASLTIDDLFEKLKRPEFLIYFGIIIFSTITLVLYIHHLEAKQERLLTTYRERLDKSTYAQDKQNENKKRDRLGPDGQPTPLKPIIIIKKALTPKAKTYSEHEPNDLKSNVEGTGRTSSSFWKRKIAKRRGAESGDEVEDPTPPPEIIDFNAPLIGSKKLSFLYPFLTGMIGQFTVLLAKASSELVAQSVACENQFKGGWAYFVVILMLTVGATQIHWLNRGLARYDQIIIIPIFNVSYALFSVLSGGMFYQEFADFTTEQWVIFPISVFITFVGVWFVTVPDNDDSDTESTGSSLHLSDVETPTKPPTKTPNTGNVAIVVDTIEMSRTGHSERAGSPSVDDQGEGNVDSIYPVVSPVDTEEGDAPPVKRHSDSIVL